MSLPQPGKTFSTSDSCEPLISRQAGVTGAHCTDMQEDCARVLRGGCFPFHRNGESLQHGTASYILPTAMPCTQLLQKAPGKDARGAAKVTALGSIKRKETLSLQVRNTKGQIRGCDTALSCSFSSTKQLKNWLPW